MTDHEKIFTNDILVTLVIVFVTCQMLFLIIDDYYKLNYAIYSVLYGNALVSIYFLIRLFYFRSKKQNISVLRGIVTCFFVPLGAIIINFIPPMFMKFKQW